MFEVSNSVFKIDDKLVCGVSFCSACGTRALMEETNLCPYHNAKSSLYGKNPWIYVVDSVNKVKLLHLKGGIMKTKEKLISYKMKRISECCYTKKR